ncbi:MAG TPA: hypothetical protein VKT33_03400 [Candidatus Angelobacter sp.]|nr:hypothetical protein [Candidatus Angelobacter sp.]
MSRLFIFTAFLKIFVVKNIRRSANEPKAHLVLTGIANGKRSVVQHNRFMGLAMLGVVDYLINAGLAYGITSAENQTGMMPGQLPAAKVTSIFICRDDSGMKYWGILPLSIHDSGA